MDENLESLMARELDEPRSRLALALDLDDMVEALRLAQRLHPWFRVAKVGMELFSAAGPEVVSALIDDNYDVFLDVKLYDIPTTVRKAGRVIGALGPMYLTAHAQGGEAMLKAAVEGVTDGASAAGGRVPSVLGVTVLTSDPHASDALVLERAELAARAGCGGLVCAASDLATARRGAPGLMAVVPGIRPAGTSADDQARPATPANALRLGADLLVIGRAVTHAADPETAAASVFEETATALSGVGA
ncbi:MAG TPA: orotidine-5'-phosphate decarboxylase [Acidimicrobiales bacterium]|nr:orotidine-5'-phosphate decarboxylase [Acidimicrobiales bacterium]